MRDYANEALEMARGKTRDDLEKDAMLRLALTRLVEMIGEAASQYPKEMQTRYPRIPWPKVVGIRNRLIHGYDYVDYDILWDTIRNDLPTLLTELKAVLPSTD
jgi:uncharacterized protein with HEPN domain